MGRTAFIIGASSTSGHDWSGDDGDPGSDNADACDAVRDAYAGVDLRRPLVDGARLVSDERRRRVVQR